VSLKITIKSSGLGGQAQTPIDKQESTTNTIVQKGSTRLTLKVDQIDFNVSGQKKLARPISQIGQASSKQKLQPTCKDGVWIPYSLIHQIPHGWRLPVGLAHDEQWCVPHSRLSYSQSNHNKAGPIKPVLDELVANQVQQKGKASTEQVYVLRDKEVLINPIEKADEQIIMKIGSADASINESEGPIIIDNLDQSEVKKNIKGHYCQ
jgi:hypothetical protein